MDDLYIAQDGTIRHRSELFERSNTPAISNIGNAVPVAPHNTATYHRASNGILYWILLCIVGLLLGWGASAILAEEASISKEWTTVLIFVGTFIGLVCGNMDDDHTLKSFGLSVLFASLGALVAFLVAYLLVPILQLCWYIFLIAIFISILFSL